MENQQEKNYTKEINEEEQEEADQDAKVVIHTMPKRYMMQTPVTAKKAKGAGLLILVFGFIFLIVALAVFYLFVLRKPAQIEVTKESAEAQDAQDASTTVESDAPLGRNPVEADPAASSSVGIIDDTSSASTTGDSAGNGDKTVFGNGKYVLAHDSDKDGLSDIEELLLGSSPNAEDTDGDGYPDGKELLNLYDPTSKGKLADSLKIEKFVNEDYNFLIFVPSLWTVKKVDDNNSLIISLGKSQYIQIISQTKPQELSLDDWYAQLFSGSAAQDGAQENAASDSVSAPANGSKILDSQRFKKGNWNGIIASNGLTYYLEHPSKKYMITLNYETGEDNTLYYKSIYDMMLQSIAINK